jgi:hypothetical protein
MHSTGGATPCGRLEQAQGGQRIRLEHLGGRIAPPQRDVDAGILPVEGTRDGVPVGQRASNQPDAFSSDESADLVHIPGENGDPVPVLQQLLDDVRTDESCSARQEDIHRVLLHQVGA